MDILEQLKRSDMPIELVKNALQGLVHPKLIHKFDKLVKLIEEEKKDFRVFFIIGMDSPAKDQFCASFMKWYMVKFNKTGRWWRDIQIQLDDTVGNAGITVFPATYLYNALTARHIASVVRDRVSQGRTFILCSTDMEAFETTFGSNFISFASYNSITVDLSIPKAGTVVI